MTVDPGKLAAFYRYRDLRKLGDYVSPAVQKFRELRNKILTERQQEIEKLEKEFDDFRETYDRMEAERNDDL